MTNPKKESTSLHRKLNSRLCLNCGFPNRESNRHCMYCKTSLLVEAGLISWIRRTYYILRWRWQIKHRREKMDHVSRRLLSNLKVLGYFTVGVVLSGAGLYLFSSSVTDKSFSSGLIAVFFLSYGVFTLKSLFAKKTTRFL